MGEGGDLGVVAAHAKDVGWHELVLYEVVLGLHCFEELTQQLERPLADAQVLRDQPWLKRFHEERQILPILAKKHQLRQQPDQLAQQTLHLHSTLFEPFRQHVRQVLAIVRQQGHRLLYAESEVLHQQQNQQLKQRGGVPRVGADVDLLQIHGNCITYPVPSFLWRL